MEFDNYAHRIKREKKKRELSKEREEKIEESFKDQEVTFHYPNNIDDFDYLIDIRLCK